MITQVEILELLRLKRQSESYSRYRESIRQRLLAGAEVEPGLRHVRVQVRQVIRFSQYAFRRLFGAEWVEQQRERIPPEIHREMFIEDRGVPDLLGE